MGNDEEATTGDKLPKAWCDRCEARTAVVTRKRTTAGYKATCWQCRSWVTVDDETMDMIRRGAA